MIPQLSIPKLLVPALGALSLALASCVAPPRHPGDYVESRYDRRENKLDRAEDRYDRRHYSGPGDFVENRVDRRENKLDRREDRWDRRGAW